MSDAGESRERGGYVSRSQAEKVVGWVIQTGTMLALMVGGYYFSKLDGTVGRLEQTLTELRVHAGERGARQEARLEALGVRVDKLEREVEALGRKR